MGDVLRVADAPAKRLRAHREYELASDEAGSFRCNR